MKLAFDRPTLLLSAGAAGAALPRRRPAGERATRAALFAWLEASGAAPTGGAHLSHSGGRVAYLAGVPGGAGVDLEWLRPRDVASLARFAYSRAESEVVAARQGPARLAAFYELWVLKEAAAKLLGLGLFEALSQARFEVEAGVIRGALPGCPDWQARLYAPQPQLRLAVVARGAPDLATLRCRDWDAAAGSLQPADWPIVAAGARIG